MNDNGHVSAEQFLELALNRTITDLVVRDLEARAALGLERYGVPLLDDNTKKDALREAYQEALDLAIYLRLELERRGDYYGEAFRPASSGAGVPDSGDFEPQ